MDYHVLTVDDQDDVIVQFMLAQERDHQCHTVNKERYEAMLTSLPAGKFRDRITQLLAETNDRLEEVGAIIEATRVQMPPTGRLEKALTRVKDKEAAPVRPV